MGEPLLPGNRCAYCPTPRCSRLGGGDVHYQRTRGSRKTRRQDLRYTDMTIIFTPLFMLASVRRQSDYTQLGPQSATIIGQCKGLRHEYCNPPSYWIGNLGSDKWYAGIIRTETWRKSPISVMRTQSGMSLGVNGSEKRERRLPNEILWA